MSTKDKVHSKSTILHGSVSVFVINSVPNSQPTQCIVDESFSIAEIHNLFRIRLDSTMTILKKKGTILKQPYILPTLDIDRKKNYLF